MTNSVVHTNTHSGRGQVGAEEQSVLLSYLHIHCEEQLCIPQPHSDLPLLEQFLLWKMPQIHCVIWPADEEALSKVWWPQGSA